MFPNSAEVLTQINAAIAKQWSKDSIRIQM